MSQLLINDFLKQLDSYRYPDYKEKVIVLLLRVTTVSVQTVQINRRDGEGQPIDCPSPWIFLN
jgi:hypothetical protein